MLEFVDFAGARGAAVQDCLVYCATAAAGGQQTPEVPQLRQVYGALQLAACSHTPAPAQPLARALIPCARAPGSSPGPLAQYDKLAISGVAQLDGLPLYQHVAPLQCMAIECLKASQSRPDRPCSPNAAPMHCARLQHKAPNAQNRRHCGEMVKLGTHLRQSGTGEGTGFQQPAAHWA